jgi:membrane fusion protein (multidrug efflux system)
MNSQTLTSRKRVASVVLVAVVAAGAVVLGMWKYSTIAAASAAAANQPEPMESVMAATAAERQHRPTTAAIGTAIALRSITLRNELAGTVRRVALTPGQVVEPGTLLVGLDVSVEEAELKALEAQAQLAEVSLARMQRMTEQRAASAMELDQAQAERDVARAQMERTRAIIERKTIRAPFRARVGLADVHPGQYLNEGTELTTLQGVDEAAHVDFTVPQRVATTLRRGATVDVFAGNENQQPIRATILAIDARVDPNTRNATVRAKVDDARAISPGASVRVHVPTGPERTAVAVPVSALRKGPGGDHVFVISPDKQGKTRAHVRPVQAGAVLGDEVVIEQGLTAGEQVAVSGSFKLRDAVLVAIADFRPDQAPPGKAAPADDVVEQSPSTVALGGS